MTVSTTTRRAGPFYGNGIATSFPFTFKVFDKTNIQVLLTDSNGNQSVLTLDSAYSVSVNADQTASPGGTVTYPISGAALPSGSTLTIIGSLPYTQTTSLPAGGNFSPTVVEQTFDRQEIQIQQLVEALARAFVAPASIDTSVVSTQLPAPGANKLIGWNSGATGLQNVDPTTLASIVAFGTANADIFTGDGATKIFNLSANPGAQANLDVSVGGVTQLPTTDYVWTSGTTLTFTSAPANGVKILVRYLQALPQGTTDSGASTYTPGGAYGSGTVGMALNALQCANRAALQAIDPTKQTTAYLAEAGRSGFFVWRSGDYSAQVAADTLQGIYISANGVNTTVGAWVRVTPGDGEWHLDWFGVPNDPAAGNGGGSEVQSHTQLTAVINLGNIVKPSKIVFGSKIYTLGGQLPQFNWQVILEGSRAFQGTIIVKRYVEASSTRGVFAFNDFGADLRDLTFRGNSGSGGAGISAILTLNQPASGRLYLRGVYISMGSAANYSLYVDGSTNTTVSGPSYRGLFIAGGEYFGASIAAISLNSINHWLASGVFVTNSGGSSNVALQVNGNVNAYNDDLQFQGILGGRVNLNWVSRSTFSTPMVDNWTVDANTTSTMRVGNRVSGAILTNNASADAYIDAYDGMVVAAGGNSSAGYRKWGSGKLQQWGTVTTSGGIVSGTSWPVSFTSSNINALANGVQDAGTNLITLAQIIPVVGNATFNVKAINMNYSAISIGGANVIVRWFADGT